MKIRCPIDFQKGKKKEGEYSGMERISRHPALWFLGLTCLGSAVTTVYAAHAAMFTFPVVFAYLGGAHQDQRFRRSSGGVLTADMEAISSNVPFVALLTGRQSWKKLNEEMKWTNAGLAVAVAASIALKRMR